MEKGRFYKSKQCVPSTQKIDLRWPQHLHCGHATNQFFLLWESSFVEGVVLCCKVTLVLSSRERPECARVSCARGRSCALRQRYLDTHACVSRFLALSLSRRLLVTLLLSKYVPVCLCV